MGWVLYFIDLIVECLKICQTTKSCWSEFWDTGTSTAKIWMWGRFDTIFCDLLILEEVYIQVFNLSMAKSCWREFWVTCTSSSIIIPSTCKSAAAEFYSSENCQFRHTSFVHAWMLCTLKRTLVITLLSLDLWIKISHKLSSVLGSYRVSVLSCYFLHFL